MFSVFVCVYHSAAQGSNPKRPIYAFINLYSNCQQDENEHKEAGIIKKHFSIAVSQPDDNCV